MTCTALVTLRKSLGLSQGDVASMIGISYPEVSKLELGSRAMTRDLAERLSGALGGTPEQFMPAPCRPLPKAVGRTVSNAQMTKPAPVVEGATEVRAHRLPVVVGPSGAAVGYREDQPFDWVEAPANLSANPRCYAAWVFSDDMDPRYLRGQTLFVHGGFTPLSRSGVIIETAEGRVILREFVRETDGDLILKHYHPQERHERLPRTHVRRCHSIVGLKEH
jgi:phage repressor protein C with HTH and peptisase S24 domain